MAALWGWKHPTHRTQTDQAGKTTTQSARCYVFCDCTHIRIECIDGVDGAPLGTKTIRTLNLCGDGWEPTPHAQGNPLVPNTVGESDEWSWTKEFNSCGSTNTWGFTINKHYKLGYTNTIFEDITINNGGNPMR